MHRVADPLLVPGAPGLPHDDGRAGGQALKNIEKQAHEIAHAVDGAQGLLAHEPAHDDGVGDAVDLLTDAAQKNRQEKQHHLLPDHALRDPVLLPQSQTSQHRATPPVGQPPQAAVSFRESIYPRGHSVNWSKPQKSAAKPSLSRGFHRKPRLTAGEKRGTFSVPPIDIPFLLLYNANIRFIIDHICVRRYFYGTDL